MVFALILTFPVAAFAETENATDVPSEDAAVSAEPQEAGTEVLVPENAEAAAPENETAEPTPVPTPQPTPTPAETSETREGAPTVDLSKINAESAMLIDADTGEVLFSKNADWSIYPASTTKLMTALLVAENSSVEDIVTLTPEIMTQVNQLGTKGSLMKLRNLKVGSAISVKDLFYGLMMCSGNDAAVVLGIEVAGSEEAFIEMMNAKAKELGMEHTNFLNAYGVYIADVGHDHYSTASDMGKLAAAAYKVPLIQEAMGIQSYKYESVSGLCENEAYGSDVVENTNFLLHTPASTPQYSKYLYSNATGMKTGLLENILPPGAEKLIKSYGCLVASASSDGLNLIALVFGDQSIGNKDEGIPNSYERWEITKYLFEYGFANYEKVDLKQFASEVAFTEQIQGVASNDPQNGELEVKADLTKVESGAKLMDAATVKGLRDGSIKLEEKTDMKEQLKAPIQQGEQLGTVSYQLDGEELYNAPLVAVRDIFQQGAEKETSEEYNVPESTFELWYLWVIVPAIIVLLLVIIRAVNLSRRKTRMAGRGGDFPQNKRRSSKSVSRSTGTGVQRRNVTMKNSRSKNSSNNKHRM